MKIKSLAFLMCFLILPYCQPKNSSENRLKERVTAYYQYLIKSDFDPTWDFLWRGARRRRSWDEWMLFCQESDLDEKLIEFSIKSISILKDERQIYLAKVKLIGKYMLIKQNKIESGEGEDEWVFENGDWFRYID